ADERFVSPRTRGDNRAGRKLFAGPTLSPDNHGGVALRDALDGVIDALHGLAAADQIAKRILRDDLLAQSPVLDLHAALFESPVQHYPEFLEVERRDEELICTRLAGF